MEIASGIVIAGIWIGCGIYAHAKKEADIFWIALILTILIN